MKSEKSNYINMDKASLKKLSKSELIALLMKQQKHSPKPIKKPKKVVHTQDDLLNNDPFPDYVITNNPFERKMDKVNKKKRGIDKQSFDIDSKYQKLISPIYEQKIHDYPMIKATLSEFRKDELKLRINRGKKNHSTDYLKLDSRISRVTKRRFL